MFPALHNTVTSTCTMGLRGALVSISILALVHLGTSTTMWKVSEPAARGMSWNGEMGPVDSVD